MVINGDFEISYLLIAFALLGAFLVGNPLDMLQLQRRRPKLLGATPGVLLSCALIKAMPMFT